jgi:hypothetical protein
MQAVSESRVRQSLALITGIQVRRWGHEVVIEGLDDPSTRQPLRLRFADCRDIHWSNHAPEDAEVEADVIGFCLGQGDFKEPALITTDLFELSVFYGSCEIDPTRVLDSTA